LEGPVASYEKFGFGLSRISLRGTDIPIGMAGILKRDFLEDVDLGYAFLPEYCGQGYAYEAAAAVIEYAFNVLKSGKVVAIVSETNQASIKLLKKLGFRKNGLIKYPGDDSEVRLYIISRDGSGK